jgi:hypothetical protein
MDAVHARAEDTSRHDHGAWCDVALPAATGVLAHTRGDWDTAITQLSRALPRMSECGGSHAQRQQNQHTRGKLCKAEYQGQDQPEVGKTPFHTQSSEDREID